MTEDTTTTVDVDGQEFLVRRDGDDLRIGRRTADDTTWFDETVPVSSLPTDARDALDGDGDDTGEATAIALRGIVSAYVERGG